MNSVANHIMSLFTIKHVVLLLGTQGNLDIIPCLLKNQNLDHLIIYAAGTRKQKDVSEVLEQAACSTSVSMPSHIEVHSMSELNSSVSPFDKRFSLVYDSLDDITQLYDLVSWEPYDLCGNHKETSVSAFEIWEAYRQVTHSFYLVTQREHQRCEVLARDDQSKDDIELSVIFPMYNIAKYLPKCVETVTAWKAPYIEFLFVDDGSPDNSAEIVLAAAKKDSRIKLLKKQNGGCASARQYGLEQAQGRYIGFIDPDDYIDPSMFRKLLRRAMVGTYEISYCGYKELYEETQTTREIRDAVNLPYCAGTTNPEEVRFLAAYLRVAIWRGIYLASMLRRGKISFYTDLRRFDDLPFKFQVFATAKSVVSVPEYLYYYRMARPGQDVAANDERLYVHFQIFKHLDEYVNKQKDKDILDLLQIVKLHTHSWALSKLLPEYQKEYLHRSKRDLLTNMTLKECFLVYRNGTSRRDKANFLAIIGQSRKAVKVLSHYTRR